MSGFSCLEDLNGMAPGEQYFVSCAGAKCQYWRCLREAPTWCFC